MKLFKIGDVAKMFRVSTGTLRHYEQLGLLIPESVDPETGYRLYSARQFEVLNTICYLRALDMPLPKIAQFLANRDTSVIEERLLEHKREIARRRRELALIERKLDNRLQGLFDAQTGALGVIREKTFPPCRVISISERLEINGFLDMEAPIRRLDEALTEPAVFLGKVGVGISAQNLCAGNFSGYDCVFLLLDKEDGESPAAVECPAQRCVFTRFKGSHESAPAQYARLMEHIDRSGLEPAGGSREITLIDYGFTNDTEKFVTEIRIPVRERSGDEEQNT